MKGAASKGVRESQSGVPVLDSLAKAASTAALVVGALYVIGRAVLGAYYGTNYGIPVSAVPATRYLAAGAGFLFYFVRMPLAVGAAISAGLGSLFAVIVFDAVMGPGKWLVFRLRSSDPIEVAA